MSTKFRSDQLHKSAAYLIFSWYPKYCSILWWHMQSTEASYVCNTHCRLIKTRRNTLRSHCLIIIICVSGEELVVIRTLRSSECMC